MGNRGICLALDYHRGRVQELCANLSRLGVTSVTALLADATQSIPLKPASFDAILIDAPCSALGVVRRHPEIKTRLKETDLATFPPRQRAMLDQAGPLLRPGGWLLYATCTTEPAENEDLILAFLKTQPGFRLAPAADFLPPAAAELAPQGDFFFTSPESHDLDGFFGALMVKETEG
jgi:16S rRNA (cytosine967-C5)-methyltransferase